MESVGLRIEFANGKVRVYKHNYLIMIGNKEGTLYTVECKINVNSCQLTNTVDTNLWHRRYCHLGSQNLDLLVHKNLVDGLSELKNKFVNDSLCEACILGKSRRQPFNKLGTRAKKPLELVHSDVCGPITPVTWDGNKYFVTFIDDYTHFTMVFLIRNKSEVFKKFETYYNTVTKHFNSNLLKLRIDNGREYLSDEFREFCNRNGIVMQHTVPYNPEMNGVAEKMNNTLMDKARTSLIDSGMKKEFWGEAILFATYVTNRSPVSGREKTPCELWEGRKPDVSNLRVFGCAAYNHVPKELRRKLDNKSKKMIMIGYNIGGYKLFDEEKQTTVTARNVVFDERAIKSNKTINIPDYDTLEETEDKTAQENEDLKIELAENKEEEFSNTETSNNIQENEPEKEERSNQRGREKRKIQKPKWQEDYVLDLEENNDEALFALLSSYHEDVPMTYNDIQEREDKSDWEKAVIEELKVLEESETFEIVPRRNEKLLDAKWVFTRKDTGNNMICKARLVVRGYQQQEKFEDVYSPVLRLQTLRTLLSVAARRDYHIHQMDVKGAFLYGRIDEDVYLKPPEGMNIQDGYVLKLKKSLYGLKKSPKYWYEKFNETIISYGFKRSDNDYCLFTKGNIYLLLYVDDLLILSDNLKDVESVKNFLKTKFRMKDMGNDNLMYLGISIKKHSEGISIDQSKYLQSVLKKFNMENCKGCDTPMDINFRFDENETVDMTYEHKCRSLIGSLMYATVGSRPDLAASVYYLSRFQSKPNAGLWRALKRLLRYVRKTVNFSLLYTKDESSVPLVGYADADFARTDDRKSTSGYFFKVFNNSVVWRSRKQTTVTLSTTEAEFVALCEAIMEASFMLKLLADLNIKISNVTIYEDNQSTIKAIKNTDQKRLKHIDVKYNYIKQKVEQNIVKIEYISTKDQLADVFTKPLGKTIFVKLVDKLGLISRNDCVEEEC